MSSGAREGKTMRGKGRGENTREEACERRHITHRVREGGEYERGSM